MGLKRYDYGEGLITTSSGRQYPFHSDSGGGGSFLRINDTAKPWLAHLARNFRPEFARALGKIGWWLREEMRKAIEAGGPAGSSWPGRSDVQQFHKLDRKKKRRSSLLQYGQFGRLIKAVGYKADRENLRVQIGWLSASAAPLAAKLQAGFETPISEKMRAMFFAAGSVLAKSGSIVDPARPLVRPLFQQVEAEIPRRIEAFIVQYLERSGNAAKAA